jgi:DNA polymerase III subunit alpha
MSARFVHLRLHTEYSLQNGLIRVKPLAQAAAAASMPGCAVTDHCNLFGMVKFYRACESAGVKPIIGVDLTVGNEAEPLRPSRIALLCQDQPGYRHLSDLVTRCYTDRHRAGNPLLRKEWLDGRTEGLIALSGGRLGDVGQALLAGRRAQARGLLEGWLNRFPDRFYLEVQRTGREGEEDYLHLALDLALEMGVPVVATNDVHFLRREDFEAHEARVCIQEGRTLNDPRRPRLFSEEQYLKSPIEMDELFSDIPEALENSVEIAQRCNLDLTLGENFLPNFPIPDGATPEQYLSRQAEAGLERRLARSLSGADEGSVVERHRPYEERLARELEVISGMGFSGYFLIVADFIQWARNNGVPVGPGRGSGAGSLVAYALGITDLDPLRYDLLFERFLNPERVSLPDFDVDFCMEGRDRVIDYVASRYGRDRVAQIITYGSMAARAVVRDVGRVLGYSYGFVDRVAKLIPFEIGVTLDKALEQEEELRRRYEQEDEVRALIDLGRALEGLARNAGKHAGGVVIAPSPLVDFMPLYCEQGAEGVVTQLDKDDVEALGLVKFDFLGLRTLTIIDWAVTTVNEARSATEELPLDIATVRTDDPATFELLKRCATTAVFQLESRGMKDLIRRLQPDRFEDVVALVALFRPGPLQSGMVDDFIDRKHGRARVDYPHPALQPILEPTYGVILYQEQVMQIAQVLAGYTLGEADLLRRAMGKKKPEEMAKQRSVFVSGALRRGVQEATATYIFDLMEKFAGYGFNKSHSAAYALLAYQTAWLKVHYPAAFMAAVLSSDMDNTDKVVLLMEECRAMGLNVLPPDINTSAYRFTVRDPSTIRYGLGAIKGVGEGALEGLLAEREQGGAFEDLFSFCRRVDHRKLNRRVLEALVRAGALDALGPTRASLMATLPLALQVAEQHLRDRTAGQEDLFGGVTSPAEAGRRADTFVDTCEWDEAERLAAEKETLGLYLTGHPITRYETELTQFVTARLAELRPDAQQTAVVAGLMVGLRTMSARRGGRLAFVVLDDRTARLEVSVFPEVFQRYRDLLVKDKLLIVEGSVVTDEYTGGYRMTAERLYDVDQAREAYAKQLIIALDGRRTVNGFTQKLGQTLAPFRDGACPVCIEYRNQRAEARLTLSADWRIRPTEELLRRLGDLAGPGQVRLVY